MRARFRFSGVGRLAAAGVLWGTGGLTGTLFRQASGVSPLAVASCRLGFGGLALVVLLAMTSRRWPSGAAAWRRVLAIGLLAAEFQSTYFLAVSLTSLALATLVTIGSAPVLVLAAGRVLGLRRITRRSLLATGLALTGLGLLVGLPSGGFTAAAVLGGAGLAVAAASGFAAITLLGARPARGLEDSAAIGFGFVLGGLVLLPVAALTGPVLFAPRPVSLLWLAVLATAPTAVAYSLYLGGLRSAAPATGALLSLLEPLTATVLGVLVLGNRLSAAGTAGGLLLGAAVLAAVRGEA